MALNWQPTIVEARPHVEDISIEDSLPINRTAQVSITRSTTKEKSGRECKPCEGLDTQPPPISPLCSDCSRITLGRLFHARDVWDHHDTGVTRTPLIINYSAPEHSRTHCSTCRLLFDYYPSLTGPTKIEIRCHRSPFDSQILDISVQQLDSEGKPLEYEIIARYDIAADPGTFAATYLPSRRYVAAKVPGTFAATYLPSRRVGSPGSELTFSTIKRLTKNCVDEHKECRRSIDGGEQDSTPLMPSRLVDVGQLDSTSPPKIIITHGVQHAYLALSYSWGGRAALVTTKETLSSLCEGIHFDALPRTIKDAVLTTRKLGFRYLWVDSLCIVQDDVQDWAHEAALMGRIYERAFCVIAATAAPSSDIGLFISRPAQKQAVMPCQPGNPELGVMFFGDSSERSSHDPVEFSPLSRRGWVMQERMLARRTVHFLEHQVFFECRRGVYSEDNGDQFHDAQFNTKIYLARALGRMSQSSVRLDLGSPFQELRIGRLNQPPPIHYAWCRIICRFSACNLTKSQDRLPAVLGMANLIKSCVKGLYQSGHWFDPLPSVPQSLMWTAEDASLRYPGYVRSPSWSWAGLDGAVTFVWMKDSGPPMNEVVLLPSPRLCLHRISVTQRFGLSDYAMLEVTGYRKTASRTADRFGTDLSLTYSFAENDYIHFATLSHIHRCYGILGEDGTIIGWVCFDQDSAEPGVFVCIPICAHRYALGRVFRDGVEESPEKPRQACQVLLAEANDETKDEYRRVGAGVIFDLSWFKDCSEFTFALI